MLYSMRLPGVCQPPKARKEQRRRQRLRALQAGLGKEEHRARPQAGVCRAHVRRKISPSLEECLLLQKTAHEYGRMVAVGHVLRYTPF